MTWVNETPLTWLQRLALKFVTTGPLPNHVGFIMDGNRRWAKKQKVEKVKGHVEGFDRLSDVLHWCREIGIREVSVYAFSIENFKRSVEEVDALMKLACEKAKMAVKEKEKLAEVGLKIRFFGDFSLLSDEVKQHVHEVVEETKANSRFSLNICFSYTGRNDILRSVGHVLHAVRDHTLELSDISERVLEAALDTRDSPPMDLVVRTSGEVRLSDFLLWQTDFALIHFTTALWPELNFWHLLGAVFHYQVNLPYLEELRDAHRQRTSALAPEVSEAKLAHFSADVRRWKNLPLVQAIEKAG